MKRYYKTRAEAQKALKGYEPKFADRPSKEELKVRKVGTRSRAYVLATEQEMFLRRVHELPLGEL